MAVIPMTRSWRACSATGLARQRPFLTGGSGVAAARADTTYAMETARRRTFAVAGALAILLVAVTCVYRFATLGGALGGFENDEFVTLSLAQQATLGETPVRDFVEVAA